MCVCLIQQNYLTRRDKCELWIDVDFQSKSPCMNFSGELQIGERPTVCFHLPLALAKETLADY